jgi:hypothetical protein
MVDANCEERFDDRQTLVFTQKLTAGMAVIE